MADLTSWVRSIKRKPQNATNLAVMVGRALACCAATTSCNERDFADLTTKCGKLRGSASVLVKEQERRVRIASVSLTAPADVDKLCQEARVVWAEGFNAGRLSGSSRGFNWYSGLTLAAKRAAATCHWFSFFLQALLCHWQHVLRLSLSVVSVTRLRHVNDNTLSRAEPASE
jgi:hypothetical protein